LLNPNYQNSYLKIVPFCCHTLYNLQTFRSLKKLIIGNIIEIAGGIGVGEGVKIRSKKERAVLRPLMQSHPCCVAATGRLELRETLFVIDMIAKVISPLEKVYKR
jgi:hypothetical protein